MTKSERTAAADKAARELTPNQAHIYNSVAEALIVTNPGRGGFLDSLAALKALVEVMEAVSEEE